MTATRFIGDLCETVRSGVTFVYGGIAFSISSAERPECGDDGHEYWLVGPVDGGPLCGMTAGPNLDDGSPERSARTILTQLLSGTPV